jgi:hypothetical protein
MIVCPEDGVGTFLRNVGTHLKVHKSSQRAQTKQIPLYFFTS